MQYPLRTRLDLSQPLASLNDSLAGKATLAVAATGLMALAAHISLPLPFTPVPLTLQTFAVIVIGMTLGPVTAFSALVLYLAEGAMGLPVFSPHGPGGVAQLIGPDAGYLFSYPLAAAAAGWVAKYLRVIPSIFARGLTAGVASSLAVFTIGAGWLATLLHLNAATTWHMAIAPFLPGELIKIVAAATLFTTLYRSKQS